MALKLQMNEDMELWRLTLFLFQFTTIALTKVSPDKDREKNKVRTKPKETLKYKDCGKSETPVRFTEIFSVDKSTKWLLKIFLMPFFLVNIGPFLLKHMKAGGSTQTFGQIFTSQVSLGSFPKCQTLRILKG